MNHLLNANMIGTEYADLGYTYCSDDNTYTPYTIKRKAWACDLNDRPEYTKRDESNILTMDELFNLFYSESWPHLYHQKAKRRKIDSLI